MRIFLTPEWITAISTAVGAVAVVWGIITAKQKINESLETRRQIRCARVAENLIVLTHKATYAIDDIRRSYGFISSEKAKDESYQFEHYDKQLEKHGEVFNKLKNAEIHARVLFGDNDIKDAVKVLYKALSDIAYDFQMLQIYIFELSHEDNAERKKETYEHIKELKQAVYGTDPETNPFSKKLNNAVKTIEDRLAPIARIEK